MSQKVCRKCLLIRAAFFAVILGGGAGYWAAISGAGSEISMLVTFFGALLPVAWYMRRKEENDE
jgi:hypothetical protein